MADTGSSARNPAASPDPLIGRTISGRFRVLSLIARGGMGRVYRAEQLPLGRVVALKVLAHQAEDADPDFQKRFLLEASTCSKLKHPNTVTIFDYGRTDDDVFFIAMELLEGRSLRRALNDDGPFSAARTIHVAMQVCRSLREAHGMGVIHRDLKPGNVFLVHHDEEDDWVKVLDFGLVKLTGQEDLDLTMTGRFMGSPKYMAPEQIRGRPVDARTDVYALGAIVYELLCGRPPFEGKTSMDVLMAHVTRPLPTFEQRVPEIEVPEAVENVARRCLAKKAADRFDSMDAVMAALREAAQLGGVSVPGGVGPGSQSVPLAAASPEIRALAAEDSEDHPDLPEESIDSGVITQPPQRRAASIALVIAALLLVGGAALAAVFLSGGDERGAAEERSGAEAATGVETPPTAAEETALAVEGELPSAEVTAPSAEETPPPAEETAPAAEETVAVGDAEAAEPEAASGTDTPSVEVRLRSTPTGATVWMGKTVLCRRTPCDLVWTGEAAAPRRETFRIVKRGYREVRVERRVRGEPVVVDVTLRSARRPSGSPSPEEGSDDSDLSGYKDNPY